MPRRIETKETPSPSSHEDHWVWRSRIETKETPSPSSAQPPFAFAEESQERVDHRAGGVEHDEVNAGGAQLIAELVLARLGAGGELAAEAGRPGVDQAQLASLGVLEGDQAGGRHL